MQYLTDFGAALVGFLLGATMSIRRWYFFRSLSDQSSVIYLGLSIILILIGTLIVQGQSSNALRFGIGTSVLATGVTSVIMFLNISLQTENRQRFETFQQFGITNVFDKRGSLIREVYEKHLNGASRRIDILGFGQSNLLQDYGDQFSTWRSRAEVRILLLDPEFPSPNSFALQRDKEERQKPGQIETDVKLFVSRSKAITGKASKGSFEIRLYRAIPTMNLFRVDDALFWGPYLLKTASRNAPTMQVNAGGILYQRLVEHFEELWNDPEYSRPIPHEWLVT